MGFSSSIMITIQVKAKDLKVGDKIVSSNATVLAKPEPTKIGGKDYVYVRLDFGARTGSGANWPLDHIQTLER